MDSKHIDILIERPQAVMVGNTPFNFEPVTLGKSLLIERLLTSLEIDTNRMQKHPNLEMLRVVEAKRETVVRILSYHASHGKKQVFDIRYQDKQMKKLNALDDADLATLFLSVSALTQPVSKLMKELGIDRKQKMMEKIHKAKDESSSVIVGGASIYGQLIDAAAERYGWSYEYIIWGVSLANLQLMLADKVDSVYMSKEERRKARISDDNTVIDAGDPRNREMVKKTLGIM